MSRYFEARRWALLPSYVCGWITQIDKLGVQFYGTCQSFGQIDKTFRDTTQHLYQFKKICGSLRPSKTKPPIKRIWGIFLRVTLNPEAVNFEDLEDSTSWFFKFISIRLFTLKKKYCYSYDTQQKIIPNNRILCRHIVKYCNVCCYEHIFHD